jgi:hypothetical protein
MRLPLLPCLLLAAAPAVAQTTPAAPAAAETEAVKATVNRFFEGLRKGDSAVVRSTLAPGAVLHTINTRTGVQVGTEKVSEFLKAVGTPHPEVYDERIRFEQVLVDAQLASVWTPYQFYVGTKFSHCGYNSFQLVKLAAGWRIVHIIDTRRKDGCQ